MNAPVPAEIILAIDQGTTSTRAMAFDLRGHVHARSQAELRQIFPASGWVEHDGEEIYAATVKVVRDVLKEIGPLKTVRALGLTNQRETTLVWERKTGRPISNAIVWQDRRTTELCQSLKAQGREALIRERSGLLIDPYFSASKLAWILDHVEGARERARAGELAFGTIDSWLIFKLSGHKVHATDVTNASRTMLFDITRLQWDEELLAMFGIPSSLLPEVRECSADFGETQKDIFGAAIPIRGVAGDQHAAMVGQACFETGLVKATFGTGCFALVNTGSRKVNSQHRLLTTPAFQIGDRLDYALEGSVFAAGSTIQWLRDGLGLIAHAQESEALARQARADSAVWLVPAFTGLGAPYWDPHARGAILGLTRDVGRAEIVRAALEAVAFQTRDLIDAMAADMTACGLSTPFVLRADGGMVANDWFMQCLADTLGRPVERAQIPETTALGAAYLAGLGAGLYADVGEIANAWTAERRFEPQASEAEREERYKGWKTAVARILEGGNASQK